MVVLKELIFYHLLLWEIVVVLKKLIFYHLVLWEFVVVLKRTDFLPFAMLAVCGSHERI